MINFLKLKQKTKGSGSNKYTTQGSNSSGLYTNNSLGHDSLGPRLYTNQKGRGSKPKKVTLQVEKGSGPTMNTTPGCIGSGPSTYPISGIGDQVTSQSHTQDSQVEVDEVTDTGIV